MAAAAKSLNPFQFQGRSFFAFVLKPEMPLDRWLTNADEWLARSPDFFSNKPVALDISALSLTESKLTKFLGELDSRCIRVMGIFGTNSPTTNNELPPVLVPSRSTGDQGDADIVNQGDDASLASSFEERLLLIDTPVRSGQAIFHNGDVAIVGSVSSGAEVVATGSVHIYGTLRGSVLAGAEGNAKARIFCQRLAAEIVSINGYYCTADDIEAELVQKPVHAWLEDEKLRLETISRH
jgi:septum site-determining protein MinC